MEINVTHFLEYSFLGNTFEEYFYALFVFLGALIVFKIIREIILVKLNKLANKTKTRLDNALIEVVRSIRPPFYFFLSFYIGILFLDINEVVFNIIFYILIAWIGYQLISILSVFIDYLVKKRIDKEKNPNNNSLLNMLGRIAKGVVWVIVALFVLSNMGVNITSFVATMGIGGIAVALALQNILSDLFSSFSIYFDKPFEVGDFIMVGDSMGIVEKIGIKTTRLMALQGEEIVISNQELTSTKIQNFKKMHERRVVFNFSLSVKTSNKDLRGIKEEIASIIKGIKLARFDRVHLYKIEEGNLIFEVVYYLLSPEYNEYMDIQEEINLSIKEKLESRGLSFAYPVRNIYMNDKG